MGLLMALALCVSLWFYYKSFQILFGNENAERTAGNTVEGLEMADKLHNRQSAFSITALVLVSMTALLFLVSILAFRTKLSNGAKVQPEQAKLASNSQRLRQPLLDHHEGTKHDGGLEQDEP